MILTGQTRANKDHAVRQAKARHFKSSRKGSRPAEEKRGNVHFFEPELGRVSRSSLLSLLNQTDIILPCENIMATQINVPSQFFLSTMPLAHHKMTRPRF